MTRLLLTLISVACFGQAWVPMNPPINLSGVGDSSLVTIDATGEIMAHCGYYATPGGGTKSITKVAFRPRSVTSAGGSGVTLSLQDPSTSAGPPVRPDGTQDQTVGFLLSALTGNTLYMSSALSASRSISQGDPICVAIEYDGSGRLGSDSVTWAGYGREALTTAGSPMTTLFSAGSWAAGTGNRVAVMFFENTDGSYGWIDGSFIETLNGTQAYNNGSGTDEYALKFSLPTNGTIDGIRIALSVATSADFDIVLYEGTTALVTKSIDANTWDGTTSQGISVVPIPATSVTASTTYYLAIKPTTANNVTLSHSTVANSAYWGVYPQGTGWIRSGRVDAGSWSDSATIRPFIQVRFTPTSSGGGGSGGSYVVAQ